MNCEPIISPSDHKTTALSPPQRAAILELGSRGSGGQFDVAVMSELLTAGYVEIRSDDRRLVLTARGRAAYGQLSRKPPDE